MGYFKKMNHLDKKILFLTTLFFSNLITWSIIFDLSQVKFLKVNFFDIGQGDAIFIETPQSHQILIDGGPTSIILEKLGREMPFWDRTLDLIILTHPEHDHMAGLIEVLKRYKVENILWTGILGDTAEYQEWQRMIEKEKDQGAKIHMAKSGQKITSSTQPGNVVLEVLFPFEGLEGQEIKNSNDTSIVTKLSFGQNSFLFTGDIYKSGERKLIESGVALNSEIFKVAHHGSKTSTSEEFIKEVNPEIAVILVGKDNSYGHPHQEVLDILSKYGINTLRTDLEGDIKIISDGINYGISNFQN